MLITPVTLVIEPLDPDATPTDELAGEAVHEHVYGAQFQIRAQLDQRSRASRRRRFGPGGVGSAPESSMVASFDRRDVVDLGWTIRSGDRVIGVLEDDGTLSELNLYVLEDTRTGAWTSGFSLVQAELGDRMPSRSLEA